jgi:hypothetical protein
MLKCIEWVKCPSVSLVSMSVCTSFVKNGI